MKKILKKTSIYQMYKMINHKIKILTPRRSISKYYGKFYGKELNWDNPKYLSEKMQILKWDVYPNNSKVIEAADKYTLHNYLSKIGLENYETPFITVYSRIEDFIFSELPESFVLKQTNASGKIIIVKDKDEVNEDEIKKEISKWFKNDYGKNSLEPHYSKATNRVICEPYFKNIGDEYRIFMVANQIGYVQVIKWDWGLSDFNSLKGNSIVVGHSKHYRVYLDEDFEVLWRDVQIDNKDIIEKPKEWDELVRISKKIASDFPVVRIDFNKIENKFKITELTFTPGNCYLEVFNKNDSLDLFLGELINIEALS